MNRKRFGTDGVRGRFGREPITPQTVLKLGWAAGSVLGGGLGGARGKVLIGKDTRVSGYLLESALEAGLSAAGVDVSLLGPMPTPAVAYLTRASRAQAGIVVSASHNAYQDNGIKFFGADGRKLPDQVESDIEARMDQPLACVESAALGKATRFPDAAGRYIESCKSTVPYGLSFAGLRIVIDCANGAAYYTAPSVFEELGATVHAIAVRPDGFNINAGCGSTDIAALQREVTARGADVGIALDGDGDRVVLVDAAGARVDGDQLLYALAMARHRGGRLRGGVVGTLMSNLGLELALREADIAFSRTQVGDRYVLEEMLARGWELGGETSGHIICLDKCTTGDGIVAALEALQLMVDSERSLEELVRAMSIYPQKLINVKLAGHMVAGFDLTRSALVAQAVRQAENELAAGGRVVLRPSGTEPVVRVMVEGNDPGQVVRISGYLAETVAAAAREGR